MVTHIKKKIIFGNYVRRKLRPPKITSAENYVGRKLRRPKITSAENYVGRKLRRLSQPQTSVSGVLSLTTGQRCLLMSRRSFEVFSMDNVVHGYLELINNPFNIFLNFNFFLYQQSPYFGKNK